MFTKLFTAIFGLSGGILIGVITFRSIGVFISTPASGPSEGMTLRKLPVPVIREKSPDESSSIVSPLPPPDAATIRIQVTPSPTQSPSSQTTQSQFSATPTLSQSQESPATTVTPSPTISGQHEPTAATTPSPTALQTPTAAPTKTPSPTPEKGRGLVNKPEKDRKDEPIIDLPGLLSVNPLQ